MKKTAYWIVALVLGLVFALSSISDEPWAATPQELDRAIEAPKIQPREALYVTGNRVNIRSQPTIAQNVLGQAYINQKVALVERGTDWHRIALQDGTVGWMSAKYLSSSKVQRVAKPAATAKRSIGPQTTQDIRGIRDAMIRQSIAAYPGNCPCPYNRASNGTRCGKRSAWSKPGGYAPLCYESDITDQRVATFLARQRGVTR